MSAKAARRPFLPPRWFIRGAWSFHRALYSWSGGRLGLKEASANSGGMLRLRTVGRRTGKERSVMLGFIEDGPNLVLIAMNGWADGHPAWLLNLQAHPDAVVNLPQGERAVHARLASAEEHPRLWAMMAAVSRDLDAYEARRSHRSPLIVLEPR